ncbi:MAG: DNA-3-methyladenine glycosylase [Zymomonas mobilis subsp. pomaceae]|uniref:DNA-3-methyladenine glycosylase II n=1 Tax=Zymomonas mobilis subsp. pomaceae (strain ATCC 29192 / DSM 22645 / JCM 10191 / CCUG 17912 / NBRC 13757 / NCIMB 11200 / NRRL B-4491 / Barker I) TaxID=579138 RepID=F8ESF1_ZYMMT|nr:DNA-3-methyladenine glycosylase [Zymomonas mobilis]AEI37726.1 HhH-GPD family protein [Zymomonas mobilis subsp. pomaceae ATCC 29192]MDX5949093.1 DNA-3-methyladenine glycosylase [Zymomonas mobilis subsp. pomaceae]GEB88898.1 DNA-3-methyladenine glycosylase II [Zymomonas mobilis subsp. pomaceae]
MKSQLKNHQTIRQKLDEWSALYPLLSQWILESGYPHYCPISPDIASLSRIIIGQQLHTKVAETLWQRISQYLGIVDATSLLLAESEDLRKCGLSLSKIAYLKDLGRYVSEGIIDLTKLPKNDEEALRLLMQIHGIGRWSAENYLIFAEGRLNIWPAADLAIRIEVGRFHELDYRAKPSETVALGNNFRPFRSILALFLWHHYRWRNNTLKI